MEKNIKVTNNSEVGVRFSVLYTINGKRVINKPKSSIARFATRTIKVPEDATNIKIDMQAAIKVDKWFHFYYKSIAMSKDQCFVIYGHRWHKPICKEINC